MKLHSQILIHGFPPVPWKVPQVFMKKSGKTGKTWKTAVKDKGLEFWQAYVASYAKDAMHGKVITTGPLWVKLEFTTRHPDGEQHGKVLTQDVQYSGKHAAYIKKGKIVPDLDNLIKAVLDGLEGVVFGNDAQVCQLTASRRFGPHDGVWAWIWEFTEEDNREDGP